MNIELLKKLGFSDKAAKVYLALLRLGPSSVRSLAQACMLNRGTTYDALKWLQDQKVVNYYKKDTKQTFVAENPETLHSMVAARQQELAKVDTDLERAVPELQALYHKGGERPVARYFAQKDIAQILHDVLDTCERVGEKMYRVYSTQGIRDRLYEGFESFSDERVKRGITVEAIAIGDGGELRGLDERKWLKKKSDTPTYIIMYAGKTAYISLNAKDELVGVVIENDGVYQTQQTIFDALWEKL